MGQLLVVMTHKQLDRSASESCPFTDSLILFIFSECFSGAYGPV